MMIAVLYFASLRERAGTERDTLELSGGARIADVVEAAGRRHPGLLPLGPGVRCARNAEFASFDAPLADGDEVAFLPPVSGG